MKKYTKRFLSAALACTMAAGSAFTADLSGLIVPGVVGSVDVYAANGSFTKQGGWFETAYAEWGSVANATGFAAYVKGANEADSKYVRLDNELIRKYPNYFRADAVGLKEGSYVIKVVPYINGELDESAAFVTDTISVKAHDRSGGAFSSRSTYKTGSGAYNDDGTLKSDAIVLYITKDTAKTVQLDVIKDAKGNTQTFTGIQDILTARQKGYDKTPLDIRIIGTVTKSDLDRIDSSEEGLQIKGKSAYAEMNITIEGIGEDATIKDFGMLLRNCGNVELRNFAVMCCMDDCISIDTTNENIWVHNIDLFYGNAGSDSDQAKGDGTVDIKGKSNNITVSYNHLWDSGKTSLCGMGTEQSSSLITYHHNWFDHSDSRHPRIRDMSVHVYNNYFDGNSKYGVGAARSSNAFVESNYFEDCKHPMLSSMQGSDIMVNNKSGVPVYDTGSGTFSSENGGIIKAYNNIIIGSDKVEFDTTAKEPIYYDASSTDGDVPKAVQFDAYLASSRDEKVPSTVKALQGGRIYDNFDTSWDLGVDESDITPVEQVPEVVKAWAGRINGGDFTTDRTKYTGLTDASNSNVDSALKSDVVNYTSSLVSVGGISTGGEVSENTTTVESVSESTTQSAESQSQATTEAATEATTSSVIELKPSDVPSGTLSSNAEKVGTNGAFDVLATADKTVSVTSSQIKLGGAGTTEYRSIVMRAAKAGVLTVKAVSSSDKNERTLKVIDADGTEYGTLKAGKSETTDSLTLEKAGTYYITSTNAGINVSDVLFTYDASQEEEPVEAIMNSASATFEGKIGVNYLLELPDTIANDSKAYVVFTRNGAETKQYVPEAEKTTSGDKTLYKFTYYTVAKEIRDTINLKLYASNGTPVTLKGNSGKDYTETGVDYSLYTYASKKKTSSDEKMAALATAVEDYCTAAQIYFDYNADGLTVSDAVKAVTSDDLSGYAAVFDGTLPAGVTNRLLSAVFDSDNSLRITFEYDGTVNPYEYKYMIDGEETDLIESEAGAYYLEVSNVAAKELDQTHVFTVSDGTDTYNISCSVLTYARSSVRSGTDERKDLGRSLYLYAKAAKAYFG